MENLKNKIQNKKGITLVALVVTIIILLILAGITISQLTENGLFNKAKQAKEKYHTAEADENIKLDNYETWINNYLKGNGTSGVTVENVSSVRITFNLNGVNRSNNQDSIRKNYVPGATITLPVLTRTGYEFKGWYDNQEGIGNPVIEKTATSILAPSSETTYYAQWDEPRQAFRSYGIAVATDSKPGTYGTLGTSVQLNGGNEIAVKGTNKIADNWKVFYEDDFFVYLIYGDYYPVSVQTAEGTIQLAPNENFTYGVQDSKKRSNLLKYLRNYSNYTWNLISCNDIFEPGGNQYTSWSNLQTALSGLSSLSGKSITVQGSPDVELWVKSWNAKGNTGLEAIKDEYGYKVTLANAPRYMYSSISSINVKTDSRYNETADSTNHTGYYDTLYFPHTSKQPTAANYWLASPGYGNTNTQYEMCKVKWDGTVETYYGYQSNGSCCTRPVISIAK